jgi:hypothetical protein
MNKSFFIGMIIMSIISSNALFGCPIKIKNNSNLSLYVVTAPIANQLSDIATESDIKNAIAKSISDKLIENDIQNGDFRKIWSTETAFVGSSKNKTYYLYMLAELNGKNRYIRISQIQFTRCIPEQEKKAWWDHNTIQASDLKEGILTPTQKEYLSLTNVESLLGYSKSKEYKNLHKNLLAIWKLNNADEPIIKHFYKESLERNLPIIKNKPSTLPSIGKKKSDIEFVDDYS